MCARTCAYKSQYLWHGVCRAICSHPGQRAQRIQNDPSAPHTNKHVRVVNPRPVWCKRCCANRNACPHTRHSCLTITSHTFSVSGIFMIRVCGRYNSVIKLNVCAWPGTRSSNAACHIQIPPRQRNASLQLHHFRDKGRCLNCVPHLHAHVSVLSRFRSHARTRHTFEISCDFLALGFRPWSRRTPIY